jgi:hypothetical protein
VGLVAEYIEEYEAGALGIWHMLQREDKTRQDKRREEKRREEKRRVYGAGEDGRRRRAGGPALPIAALMPPSYLHYPAGKLYFLSSKCPVIWH